MLLGYCAGVFFSSNYSAGQRQKIILLLGIALIVFFTALRFTNAYGDPYPWQTEKNGFYTFFSFMKIHKYPPSLLYLCITIGPALILLSLIEKVKNRFTNIAVVFGRTAFFYYILHFFFIHILLAIAFYVQGNTIQQAMESMKTLPFMFAIPGQGFGLAAVYGIWAFVIITLFPLCKWYDQYKTKHKEKWWLSYL
jgi:uncharacterized membrane protein